MIPAEICEELSYGQGKVYGRTDRRTYGQTQSTTIPLRPERPRGKKALSMPVEKYIENCENKTFDKQQVLR